MLQYGDLQVVGMDPSISVGNFDETALELGRLNTVEGRFPEAADEIVLQESWKARLEGLEVGDTLTLLTEKGERDYIVSGFLENYTQLWVDEDDPNYLVRKLPAALVSLEGAPGEAVQTDALVYLPRMRAMEPADGQFREVREELKEQTDERGEIVTSPVQGAYNTALYYGTPPENNLFQAVFTFAILAATVTVVYVSLSFYLKNYQSVAVKMYMVGGTDEYALKLLYIWIGLIVAPALLLNFLLHGIFAPLM